MILLFADMHYDLYRRFSTQLENGINSRLYEQAKVTEQIIKKTEEYEPTAIVCLGDLFNGLGATISKKLYWTVANLLNTLASHAPLFLIVGNHDVYSDINILSPLSSDNIMVVSSPVSVSIDGHSITMVPWASPIPKSRGVLLGHLDIEGAYTGLGHELPGTISIKDVASYDRVFSGHWHTRQLLNNGQIEYIGVPMQNIFGDMTNVSSGITLLNRDMTSEFVELKSPTFNEVIISSNKEMEEWKKKHNPHNYYKLIIKDRKIEIPKLTYRQEIEWNIEESIELRLEQKEEEKIEDTTENFINKSTANIDKALAVSTMREIMREV